MMNSWRATLRSGKGCFESLERYIVHGLHDLTLRHPGLDESQPTQDSMEYMWRIFNKDIYYKACAIRYIKDIDFARLKEDVAEACVEEHLKREIAEVSEARRLFRYLLQKLTACLTQVSEP